MLLVWTCALCEFSVCMLLCCEYVSAGGCESAHVFCVSLLFVVTMWLDLLTDPLDML